MKGYTQMSNLKDLLNGAQDDGLLDQSALYALNVVDLGATIQDNLGIDPDSIDSTEVFGLFALIDDSTSIRFAGNTQVVRDGYNGVLDSLMKSQSRDDILVSTTMLNSGVFQAPVALPNAKRLDNTYNPQGWTPLYDRTLDLGALATIKRQEFRNTGANFRGVLLLVSDGNDEGSKANAKRVAALLTSLQAQEVFQVIALGINDGRTDFKAVFGEMGVLPNLILTVDNDPHSIREAFGVVSRATVSASQGGSLSQSGLGGFGANP
jgi:hypothetical protein